MVNEDGSFIGWGKLGDTFDTGMNVIIRQWFILLNSDPKHYAFGDPIFISPQISSAL